MKLDEIACDCEGERTQESVWRKGREENPSAGGIREGRKQNVVFQRPEGGM